jgi:hypothetical protein
LPHHGGLPAAFATVHLVISVHRKPPGRCSAPPAPPIRRWSKWSSGANIGL